MKGCFSELEWPLLEEGADFDLGDFGLVFEPLGFRPAPDFWLALFLLLPRWL